MSGPAPRPTRRARVGTAARSRYSLSSAEASQWAARFGVPQEQVRRDFVISHLLDALAPHADRVIFYGGTALARTHLPDLRLSEDIDLLSVGPRPAAASVLDTAITGLEAHLGPVSVSPPLAAARRDTDASLVTIAGATVRVQLIDGRAYARWPTATSPVDLRYAGLGTVQMVTFTPAGFVGAKTVAWCDQTRNAPRDLYDLWALTERGWINAEAVSAYKHAGPTGRAPQRWSFPAGPPAQEHWLTSLSHQCVPRVTAAQAYDVVVAAWERAVG